MNNTFKLKAILRLIGIIALVAIVGFSMAACDDGTGASTRETVAVETPAAAATSLIVGPMIHPKCKRLH
jgi:hypothetical protein